MIVIDASIVVRIAAEERGAVDAAARIIDEDERLAPDWIRVEVANALSGKVRRENFPAGLARAALDALPIYVPELVDSFELIDDAFALSMQLDHAVYDCLYLAAALRRDGVVVTADAGLYKAAARVDMAHRVELLL